MSMPEEQIAVQPVEDPILCSPYEEPELHWLYGHEHRDSVEEPRPQARELLVQERARRKRPALVACRRGTRRPAARQRAARRREALAGVGLAGRVGDDEAVAGPLAARGSGATAVLLPGRSRRDGHLPARDARARATPAAEAGARRRRVRAAAEGVNPTARDLDREGGSAAEAGRRADQERSEAHSPLRLQDGDRQRQDGGHGDARGVGVLQTAARSRATRATRGAYWWSART